MWKKSMALFLCVFLSFLAISFGFNVDIPSRTVHYGQAGSMFGFTVQSHVDGIEKVLLVGAPEANSNVRQRLTRPGVVYQCRPNKPNDCSEMVFDNRDNNVDKSNRPIDQKSNQWFGATLSSTGLNGPIVACAPRYVSYVSANANHRDPVGACFVAKSLHDDNPNEFSPCRSFITNMQQRRTGVCQAGFSAAISKSGERLFMGAPGSFYWQGQLYSVDRQGNPLLLSTPEGSQKFDDTYMGYSITVGDFAGQAMQGVAVGVPRGAELRGLIVLYTWELDNIKNITGSQIGAYFGYCLASGDIDGDGYDDLIVGAPMYTKTKTDGYEHGRVYVIYQDRSRSFTRSHARTGEISKGRFGLSVTSLGDINLDGFGDFAVGAPYGGVDGKGVVYIYHGSAKGVREKYSQAITAEDVTPGLSTFGFSLSGGVDLDNNNYTDLAVGAYKSDAVVFLRSRPVIKVMAEFNFRGANKLISLEDKSCKMRNGSKAACAELMYCLNFDGINVDTFIEFEVKLELDSKKKSNKRMFIEEGYLTIYKKHVFLEKTKQQCQSVRIFLDEEIRDKLTPLEVAMSYDLILRRTPGSIPPVLDQTITNVYTDSLHIQKNCGADNICIPDLQMAVTTPNINYILGSNENVNITVEVENRGEDAFEAAYYLHMPAGVNYAKMKRFEEDSTGDITVYCSVNSKDVSGNSTLKCDMGNPLPRDAKVKFQVVLEIDPTVSVLEFDMESNSTNPEHGTEFDNKRHLSISVIVKAQLHIIGTSDPPELHYNASLYETENFEEDKKLGPQIIHKYNIKNEGPFAVEEAELYIMWPYQTLNGEDFMYMLIQPQTVGPIVCDVARHINPQEIFVTNPYKYYLQKEREAYENSEFGSSRFEQFWYQKDKGVQANSFQQNWTTGYYSGGYGNSGLSGESYRQTQASGSQTFGGGSYRQSQGTYGQNQGTYGQNQGNYEQPQGIFGQSQGSQGSYSESRGSRRHYGESDNNQGSYGQSQGSQGSYSESRGSGRVYGESDSSQNSYGQSQGRSHGQGAGHSSYDQGSYQSGGYGQSGNGQGHATGGMTRRWNKTTIYDEHGNVVSESESSTEFSGLGHEGEAGSSFSNRYGGSGVYNSGFSNRDSTSGITWSTEESVNKDLINAQSTYHRELNLQTPSVSSVGDDDEDDQLTGFGVNAAYNPNNEFRVGVADLGISGSSSGAQSSGSHSSGGYSGYGSGAQYGSRGASYDGNAQSGGTYGSSYSRSGSSGGSYSYSSGSSQSGDGQYTYHARSQGGYGGTHRTKREDGIDPELMKMLDNCEEKYKCEVVRCVTGRLLKGQEVWIALRSRIKAVVLSDISKDRPVKLSTLATTRVTQLPQVGKPRDSSWKTAEAQTVITPQLEAPTSGNIPLWVIILAAIVGALLLLLLIFALYKCGFFKRNRPSDRSEREPLNRDEHL